MTDDKESAWKRSATSDGIFLRLSEAGGVFLNWPGLAYCLDSAGPITLAEIRRLLNSLFRLPQNENLNFEESMTLTFDLSLTYLIVYF